MKFKLLTGQDVSDLEARVNQWLIASRAIVISSGCSISDAGGMGIYAVTIFYEEPGEVAGG